MSRMVTIIPDIIVTFEHPPIPDRRMDYRAYWEDADPEVDQNGWGETPAQAVQDLVDNFPREPEEVK